MLARTATCVLLLIIVVPALVSANRSAELPVVAEGPPVTSQEDDVTTCEADGVQVEPGMAELFEPVTHGGCIGVCFDHCIEVLFSCYNRCRGNPVCWDRCDAYHDYCLSDCGC